MVDMEFTPLPGILIAAQEVLSEGGLSLFKCLLNILHLLVIISICIEYVSVGMVTVLKCPLQIKFSRFEFWLKLFL